MDRLCRWLLIVAVLLAAFSLVVTVLRAPCLAAVAAVLIAAGAARRQRQSYSSDVYGTARFCSEEAARKAGML